MTPNKSAIANTITAVFFKSNFVGLKIQQFISFIERVCQLINFRGDTFVPTIRSPLENRF